MICEKCIQLNAFFKRILSEKMEGQYEECECKMENGINLSYCDYRVSNNQYIHNEQYYTDAESDRGYLKTKH